MLTKEQITFDQFMDMESKLDIRIGRIITSERIPKSKKLLKMTVSFNDDSTDNKSCVTNLGGTLEPEALMGLKMPFIVNLVPSEMMNVLSEVMIMVGTSLSDSLEFEDYSLGTKLL